MKVEATKRGYFNHSVIEPETEFEIPDEPVNPKTKMPQAFSSRWMKAVEVEEKAEVKKGKK